MNVVTCTVNCLSLCSGIGGLELGLSLVIPELRVVCHVEREASVAALLVARMADKSLDDAPIWDDLTTFDGAAWCGTVDIITAGFPCQPWSVAGKRKGTDDERWIWSDIIKIIREVRPGFVFLENVPGLLVHDGLGGVLGGLAEAGFDAEWGCFTAAEVGASHKRERVFILAHANNRGREKLKWPEVHSSLWHCGYENLRPEIEKSSREMAYASIFGRRYSSDTDGQHDVQGNEIRHVEKDKQFGTGRFNRIEQVSGDVADARREYINVQQRAEGPEPERGGFEFPPDQNDFEGWAQVLAEMPSLEPAVCRMADGLPGRVDRLRAVGNAVVSLEAAYAFSVLVSRIRQIDA